MKKYKLLLIFILLALLGFVFLVLGVVSDINSKRLTYLNDLAKISKNNTLKNAYLDVHTPPLVFAEYENDDSKFYIVKDKEYLYIVYMEDSIYDEVMNSKNLEDNPYRLEGHTNELSEDIKALAMEVYNDIFEENIINEDNFDSYFGNVYLDANSSYNIAIEWYISSLMVFLISGFGFYNYFYRRDKNKKRK